LLSPTIVRGDFRKNADRQILFIPCDTPIFPVPPEDEDDPVKYGFLRFPSLAMWNSAAAIAIGGASQKSAARLDRNCHRDVRARVIASESCASFAARQWNRFIDCFVWQPVVFVARFGVYRGAKVENRRAGRPRNNLRRKRN
jgi:hypothetical protein